MDFSVPYVQTTLMNDDIDIVFGKYSTPSYPYWSDCPVILSTDCERWFSNRFTIETCNFCKYHPVQGISPSVLMMMFPNGSIGFDNPFIFHVSHAKVPISTILGISIINWRNSRNQAPFLLLSQRLVPKTMARRQVLFSGRPRRFSSWIKLCSLDSQPSSPRRKSCHDTLRIYWTTKTLFLCS